MVNRNVMSPHVFRLSFLTDGWYYNNKQELLLVPALSMVIVHEMLEKFDALLGLDLVGLDQVVGGGDLQVLPLLLQVLRDLASKQLAPDHAGLLGLDIQH